MVLIHVETVFPAVFTCFHTCENTMTFTRRHLYALLFLPPCLLQSVPSLSPPADDSVSEGGRSVSNHRQHPDERTEFTLPRHLHHPPVPSPSLLSRQRRAYSNALCGPGGHERRTSLALFSLMAVRCNVFF